MLINLSNHKYEKWQESQKQIATTNYGVVLDLSFPQIDPKWTSEQVMELAFTYLKDIKSLVRKEKKKVVHIQGEFTFVFKLVTLLKQNGIVCIASTSKRNVKQVGTKKVIDFIFTNFREY